jgi:TonB family protein
MFDTLLASDYTAGWWRRPALAAVLLHVGIVIVAVAGASAPDRSPSRISPDTIRLELIPPPLPTSRSDPLPPLTTARIPLPPPLLQLRPEPPRLDVPQFDHHVSGPALPTGPSFPGTMDNSPRGLLQVDSVLRVADVDRPPELIHEIHPAYPEALRQSGLSGAVELEYVITADGGVDTSSFRTRASPHPAFTTAAMDALRGARFRAALRRGRAVAVLVRQRIRFVHQ